MILSRMLNNLYYYYFVLLGLIESPVVTLNNSYTVQEIMDRLRNQIGVHFAEDNDSSM